MTTRKSTLKNIVSGCIVRLEHRIDILNAKSIGKEHFNVFITEPFIEKMGFFGIQQRSSEGATTEDLYKKLFLKISQYSLDNTYVGVSFNKVAGLQACNFIKETPAQVFFCEYCEIFKNTFFTEHLRETASENIPGW